MERNYLALRIRAFRKLKGMTQHQLAYAIGISPSRLGAIERGTKTPNYNLINQISAALNIEPKELSISNLRKEE